MIVPDANLLIYAYDASSRHHVAAARWWEDALNGEERVALPWTVVLAFLRLTTKRAVMSDPFPTDEALSIVESWFQQPNVSALAPGPRHLALVGGLLREAGAAGDLVGDAHLAALAIEHRATMCSHDRDFERFSGFALADPLA